MGKIHHGHGPARRVPRGRGGMGHFRILPATVGEAKSCSSNTFPGNEILLLWKSRCENYLPTLIPPPLT